MGLVSSKEFKAVINRLENDNILLKNDNILLKNDNALLKNNDAIKTEAINRLENKDAINTEQIAEQKEEIKKTRRRNKIIKI